jgi:hypothetical protein
MPVMLVVLWGLVSPLSSVRKGMLVVGIVRGAVAFLGAESMVAVGADGGTSVARLMAWEAPDNRDARAL